MLTTIKRSQHNLKLIRRFEEDIWGRLATRNKPSSVLNYIYEAYQNNFKYKRLLEKSPKSLSMLRYLIRKRGRFLYKIVTGEKEFKRKKRTLRINNYLNLLKLRRFYGNLRLKQFKRSIKNLNLLPNFSNTSFAYFLESRLDVILYRSNFFTSIYAARQYINHKKTYVNGILVTKPGYRVKINDIINIDNPLFFYFNLKNRLLNEKVLGNYPSYLFINYKLGLITFVKLPTNEDVPFPFFINLKTLTNSFSK